MNILAICCVQLQTRESRIYELLKSYGSISHVIRLTAAGSGLPLAIQAFIEAMPNYYQEYCPQQKNLTLFQVIRPTFLYYRGANILL